MFKLLVLVALSLFAFIPVEADEYYCQYCDCPKCYIWSGTPGASPPNWAEDTYEWYDETPTADCSAVSCDQYCQMSCQEEYPTYVGVSGGVWTSCNTIYTHGGYVYIDEPACDWTECTAGACPNKKRSARNSTFRSTDTVAPVVAKREVDEEATFVNSLTPIGEINGIEEYDNSGAAYLGCYADVISPRDLGGAILSTGINSILVCIQFCSGKAFPFAGMQVDTCYCGNNFGAYGPSSSCTSTCPVSGTRAIDAVDRDDTGLNEHLGNNAGNNGGAELYCGGIYSNSVWETGYKGCWYDGSNGVTTATPDLVYSSTSGVQTVKACRTACGTAGYVYAALSHGNLCYCGHHYGTQDLGQNVNGCTTPCTGDGSRFCGGPTNTFAIFTSSS